MNPQIEAILRGLDFVEEHLCEPITVGDIAEAVGYSLFHFIRTFDKIVRHTPYDFLMRRRLSHAARMLLETDARIIDIALACRFESHEGFTRAFGRIFNMPPTSWRERGIKDWRYLMPQLSYEDLSFRQRKDLPVPEMVHLDELSLFGWMSIDELVGVEKVNFISLFKMNLIDMDFPPTQKDLWEIRTLSITQAQPEVVFLGVPIAGKYDPGGQFVIKYLPAGDYIRFRVIDPTGNQGPALNYLYNTFLPRAGLSLAEPLEIVKYGEAPEVFLPVIKRH